MPCCPPISGHRRGVAFPLFANEQETAISGKFEISKDKSGKFRFHLTANGAIIATSHGYESEAAAEKGIESIKTNARPR